MSTGVSPGVHTHTFSHTHTSSHTHTRSVAELQPARRIERRRVSQSAMSHTRTHTFTCAHAHAHTLHGQNYSLRKRTQRTERRSVSRSAHAHMHTPSHTHAPSRTHATAAREKEHNALNIASISAMFFRMTTSKPTSQCDTTEKQ